MRPPLNPSTSTLRRALAWLLALSACGLVFTAWRNPHLVLELGQLVRACF